MKFSSMPRNEWARKRRLGSEFDEMMRPRIATIGEATPDDCRKRKMARVKEIKQDIQRKKQEIEQLEAELKDWEKL